MMAEKIVPCEAKIEQLREDAAGMLVRPRPAPPPAPPPACWCGPALPPPCPSAGMLVCRACVDIVPLDLPPARLRPADARHALTRPDVPRVAGAAPPFSLGAAQEDGIKPCAAAIAAHGAHLAEVEAATAATLGQMQVGQRRGRGASAARFGRVSASRPARERLAPGSGLARAPA